MEIRCGFGKPLQGESRAQRQPDESHRSRFFVFKSTEGHEGSQGGRHYTGRARWCKTTMDTMLEETEARVRLLPDTELDDSLLEEIAVRRPFFQGRLIAVQGQRSEGLCLVGEGQVLLSRRNEAGEDYALFLLGPGDMFGAGAVRPEGRWLVTARGVTDGFLYVLAPANLPRLFEFYPHLGVHFLRLLSVSLERAYRRHDVAQNNVARERLFKLLSLLAEYHGQPKDEEIWLPLHLNQTELGEMVSLARETVARALAELEEEGRIRREGRKGLWVRLAGEDPSSSSRGV